MKSIFKTIVKKVDNFFVSINFLDEIFQIFTNFLKLWGEKVAHPDKNVKKWRLEHLQNVTCGKKCPKWQKKVVKKTFKTPPFFHFVQLTDLLR